MSEAVNDPGTPRRCLTFGGARSRALYDPDAPLSDPAAPMLQEVRFSSLREIFIELMPSDRNHKAS